jgi:hypothetical protein
MHLIIGGNNQKDFGDAKEFFRFVNELANEKIAKNEPPPEKIILCKTKRML